MLFYQIHFIALVQHLVYFYTNFLAFLPTLIKVNFEVTGGVGTVCLTRFADFIDSSYCKVKGSYHGKH